MPLCGTPAFSKKQQEFAKREQDILIAALSLFDGPHWEQVTVEQISKKAEIGKGTVYKHFSCKEEIYAHISLGFNDELFDAFEHVDKSLEVWDIIKQIIRMAFDRYLANPAQARLSFYCKREDFRNRLSPELRQKFENLDERFENYFGNLLQQGIDSGRFPNKPVEHLIMGLEATFEGAISMVWNGGAGYQHADNQEDYVSIISEYMLAGLVGLKR